MFFSLPSWAVALVVVAVVGAATAAGYAAGYYLREHQAKMREPFGVLQGALLGVVGLILAFGLSLAVGRYEDRRASIVTEANAIGTPISVRSSSPSRSEAARWHSSGSTPSSRCRSRRRCPTAPGCAARRRPRASSSGACGASPGRQSTARRSPARRGSTSTV